MFTVYVPVKLHVLPIVLRNIDLLILNLLVIVINYFVIGCFEGLKIFYDCLEVINRELSSFTVLFVFFKEGLERVVIKEKRFNEIFKSLVHA